MARSNYHVYTAAEEEWLRENISKYQYSELAQLLNQRFGANVSPSSVSDKCLKDMGLKRGKNTGQFTEEKMKRGEQNNSHPVGTETVYQDYVWIKLRHTYTKGKKTNEAFRRDWKQKHRYIYEQWHGEIPNGWIVVFLDSNRRNFDIDNLYAVKRSTHAQMCKNQWYTQDREATLTAIRLCELQEKLR